MNFNKILTFLLSLIILTNTVFAFNVKDNITKTDLNKFDQFSVRVYCFFTNCDQGNSTGEEKNNLNNNSNTDNAEEYEEYKREVYPTEEEYQENTDNNFQNIETKDSEDSENNNTNLEEEKQKEKIVYRDRVQYVDRVVKTQPKIIYQTVEKKPIINNTYPKEIIEKRVVEEYDDSYLRRKASNNRSLITDLSGITSDDDLSDNILDDLSDVDVSTTAPTDGQVLT
jgi:hypothetical protein